MAPVPTLLLVTGPPETGMSTLAEVAADDLAAAVFGWDWVMAGMTSFPKVQRALRVMDRSEYRRVGWSILWNLAEAQLRGGKSAILDGVADIEIEPTAELAARLDARFLLVVTRCTNPELHRKRIDDRRRDIAGWHELEWDHLSAFPTSWPEPQGADAYLDAARCLDENPATSAASSASGDISATDWLRQRRATGTSVGADPGLDPRGAPHRQASPTTSQIAGLRLGASGSQNAELVAFGVGRYDPGLPTLANVDAGRSKPERTVAGAPTAA